MGGEREFKEEIDRVQGTIQIIRVSRVKQDERGKRIEKGDRQSARNN